MAADDQNLEAILPTYDPNWEARHDAISREHAEVHAQIMAAYQAGQVPDEALSKRSEELLSQSHEAFWAQFPTSSSLKQFYLNELERVAAQDGRSLAYVEPRPNATADELHAWYGQVSEMLQEQNVILLPVKQPEGLKGFQIPLPANAQRTSFLLKYVGWHNSSGETRCTMEQTQDKAYVCFHHLRSSRGTSPMNMIENLASGVRATWLPNRAPQNIAFFIHVPPAKYGEEYLTRVDMEWSPDRGYINPKWIDIKQMPPAIREAETKPYDETPPPASETPAPSPRTPDKHSRIRGLFSRKKLGGPES